MGVVCKREITLQGGRNRVSTEGTDLNHQRMILSRRSSLLLLFLFCHFTQKPPLFSTPPGIENPLAVKYAEVLSLYANRIFTTPVPPATTPSLALRTYHPFLMPAI